MTVNGEEGTAEALRLMGATDRSVYIAEILQEQSSDRLLVPSHVFTPPEPLLSSAGASARLVQVFSLQDEQEALKVPLYYKSRGKGRGSPVFFSPLKSAVMQLFELAQQLGLPEPKFSHSSMGVVHAPKHAVTAHFAGLTAQDISGSVSIKTGKETVAKRILLQIINENRAAEPETDTAHILSKISQLSLS